MKKMTQQQLHSLIEQYFNAETSVSDEQRLRTYLVRGKYKLTPEVEDALAVMSVQHRKARAHRSRFTAPLRWAAAAAVAGVFVVVGVKQFSSAPQAMSYAYVGGRYTEDKEELNSMMDRQMSELAEQMQQSQQQFDDQLADLSEVMQQYE